MQTHTMMGRYDKMNNSPGRTVTKLLNHPLLMRLSSGVSALDKAKMTGFPSSTSTNPSREFRITVVLPVFFSDDDDDEEDGDTGDDLPSSSGSGNKNNWTRLSSPCFASLCWMSSKTTLVPATRFF
mmetsp:Transcript_49443/g.119971  ORF Transcript_49443/g.119971 Transcript_49443/m.119971 type:complete len:126 (-) Transcript_49443:1388-1765(-)